MSTVYDEVAYPSNVFAQTHPDRLAAHAMLFGLPTAPLETCRVLDVGGGDASNVIPMAMAWPEARFVSFDLAGAAVARGRAVIEALGLSNIRLFQADVCEIDLGADTFDYAIAHGFYSWVPAEARRALLALLGRHLAPHGIAFVSYNAFPGGHIRLLMRDMLLHRVRRVTGAAARAAAAFEYLNEIATDFPDETIHQALIKTEARRLIERPMEVLAHDELGGVYHPLHLTQFVDDCAAAGLQFLTEADPGRCGEGFLPPYALDDPDFDVLGHAQDLDFTVVRPYRQSLVVRREATFSRRPEPARLAGMHVSSDARRLETGEFDAGAARIQVADPHLAAALERLGAAWPATVPVADLGFDQDHLAALLRMYWVEVVFLHAAPSAFPTAPGERPRVSPLARLQAARGVKRLTSLRHTPVQVDDAFGLGFIAGLDGARTREELARDAAPLLGVSLETARAQVDTNLAALARMPLLVA